MKNISLPIITFLLLSAFTTYSQQIKHIETDSFMFYGENQQPVFKIELEDVTPQQGEKALHKYLKNYRIDLKTVKGANKEFFSEKNFQLTSVSAYQMAVRAKITGLEKHTTIFVNLLADSVSIDSNSKKELLDASFQFANGVANKAVVIAYTDLIRKENKALAMMEATLQQKLKEQEKNEKSIVENENAITQSQENVLNFG